MSARAAALGLFLVLIPAPACAGGGSVADGEIARAVRQAARASGLPEAWIRAVMARESGGRATAVSAAGAMGLMQLTPATWAEMRARLGLGPDPFDVEDNLMAGAAYLRDMLDRFGAPGFLAAYNAGPGRYAEALAGRAALPRETRRYVAALAPRLPVDGAADAPPSRTPLTPRSHGLFPLASAAAP